MVIGFNLVTANQKVFDLIPAVAEIWVWQACVTQKLPLQSETW